MMTRRFPLLLAAMFLAACRSSSSPEPAAVPVPEAPSSLPITGKRDEWILTPGSAQQRFTSTSTTSIEHQENATTVRDSLVSSTKYSLQTQRTGDLVKFSATLESVSRQGGQRISPSSGSRFPFTFSGRLERNRLSIDSLAGDCSNEAFAETSVVQRSLVMLPLVLKKDMTWTDSITTNACSGSIPVLVTTVRAYRVLGESSLGILLERHDHVTATGEGSQGQHRVRLKTEGSGSAQLTINSQSGDLLQSTATSSTTVIISASGRDQRFTQTVRERTDRMPPD